jgi:hypothetical protein
MIIRNDNITEASLGGDVLLPFTPANFRNLGDWWSTGYGVQLTGTDVDSWVGVNGNVLRPVNATYKAIYDSSDTDFNSKPSISLNPNGTEVGYTASVASGNTNKTIIIVAKMLTNSSETSIMSMNTSSSKSIRAASTTSVGSNLAQAYTDGTGYQYQSVSDVSVAAGVNFVHILQYTKSLAKMDWFFSNGSNIPTTPTKSTLGRDTNIDFDFVSFAWYLDGVIGSARFKVTDFIVINGVPTSEEIASFSSYLSTNYGI